ncbi:MAG: helix-turn-helix domain-containing protein [Chitinivibrionales bacterium]|nr:helix-turn-helix domain-containing protein [Chitinivibrionales bacterium]
MSEYFAGLSFHSFQRAPDCSAWVDRTFDFYAINYAAAGHLFWTNDGRSYGRIDAPVFFWTLPSHRYRYGSRDGTGWDHQWIAFEGPRAARYVTSGLLPAEYHRPFVWVRDTERMRREFLGLLDYLAAPRLGSARGVAMLESVLLQAREQPLIPEPRLPYHARIESLARTIAEHPSSAVDFRRGARDIGLSYSRFRRAFKAVTGQPPHAYLLRSRLERAAALLRAGATTVKEACFQAGFEDICLFSRQFKRAYRTTASEYRDRHRLG